MKVMGCGIVMGVAVFATNMWSNIFAAIVVGAIVYTVMIFVTRLLTKAEVLEAVRMVKK
jgi:hypothetical protein